MAGVRYKVVELGTVTDENLERVLNEWTAEGWVLDGIHFAMRESSKRPGMAFVLFTREDPAAEGGGDGGPAAR
ncbi:MAG: DUF4177 domain-containing protein [Deltaproteobacteria bacterium]|nr:MAG: DUF4177 domain-containing protein [Deltaproteobacteria bacterium]